MEAISIRLLQLFAENGIFEQTVIDAYATFFLRTFMKVLNTTVDILTPVTATDLTSGNTTRVLYYDGTVDYFGTEHLPYAVLAIVFCTVLTIVPTLLLLLYPFRWFQRVLACIKLQGPLLQAVMDSFQGYYKDGTEPGTCDYRWAAALPLVVRIPAFCLSAIMMDSSFFPWATNVIFIALLLLVIIQPYKASVAHYTKIDVFFIGTLIIFFTLVDSKNLAGLIHQSIRGVSVVLQTLSAVVPLIYMVCITIYWIFTRMKKGTGFTLRRLIYRFHGYNRIESDIENEMPDRLVHPEHYTQNNLNSPLANTFPSSTREGDTY